MENTITPDLLLHRIVGSVRSNLRPMALAIRVTEDLLFVQHIPMDDIFVTKCVYPNVARSIDRKPDSVSRRIERLTHLCWDAMQEQNLVVFYLGRDLKQTPTPGALMVYLAVYTHVQMPFFTFIEQDPDFLFQSQQAAHTSTKSNTLFQDLLLRDQPLDVVPVADRLICPKCSHSLGQKGQNFCSNCGQRLKWKTCQRRPHGSSLL